MSVAQRLAAADRAAYAQIAERLPRPPYRPTGKNVALVRGDLGAGFDSWPLRGWGPTEFLGLRGKGDVIDGQSINPHEPPARGRAK